MNRCNSLLLLFLINKKPGSFSSRISYNAHGGSNVIKADSWLEKKAILVLRSMLGDDP